RHRRDAARVAIAPRDRQPQCEQARDRSEQEVLKHGIPEQDDPVTTPVSDAQDSQCQPGGGELDNREQRRRDCERKCGQWCEKEGGERRVDELLLVVQRPSLRAWIWRSAVEHVARGFPEGLVVEAELLARQVAGEDEKNEQGRRKNAEKEPRSRQPETGARGRRQK